VGKGLGFCPLSREGNFRLHSTWFGQLRLNAGSAVPLFSGGGWVKVWNLPEYVPPDGERKINKRKPPYSSTQVHTIFHESSMSEGLAGGICCLIWSRMRLNYKPFQPCGLNPSHSPRRFPERSLVYLSHTLSRPKEIAVCADCICYMISKSTFVWA